ncbi:MAG TPA: PilZ domain-containing protein [Clostridia bacterium]|nr:PilZ domain-containing protein [Clostridia bacterium]
MMTTKTTAHPGQTGVGEPSPTMHDDRRKFERLNLTEHAVAVDENGLQLGRVAQASGGGMLIYANSAQILAELPKGRRMRIHIVEPASGTTTMMDVEVLYVHDAYVGMGFVTLPA